MDFPGLSGQAKMAAIMQQIRTEGIKEMGGLKVVSAADYLAGTRTLADGTVETLTFPPSDALKYVLEDGSWVAFRPSGTEPKIKLYLGTQGASHEEVEAKAAKIEADIAKLTA